MTRRAGKQDLSLKWLELFKVCATKGSLQAAADEMGLSLSTASHHLGRLEKTLGVDLFDHARRPMRLTPTGTAFLRKIDLALYQIRTAQAEASAGNPANAGYLRIGMIEDFDSDIAPDLAVFMSRQMPQCDFSYHTDSSHTIIKMLRDRVLDMGVVAYSSESLPDLEDYPFLRDPFIVIAPKDIPQTPAELMQGASNLPFLRFSDGLYIGRQIESHLRRLGRVLPNRFECANSNTLMAMVAAGTGWTITTGLLFSHGKAFQDRVQVHPFPGKTFARTLSVVATPDCAQSVVKQVRGKVSALLADGALPTLHAQLPWLRDGFKLID